MCHGTHIEIERDREGGLRGDIRSGSPLVCSVGRRVVARGKSPLIGGKLNVLDKK